MAVKEIKKGKRLYGTEAERVLTTARVGDEFFTSDTESHWIGVEEANVATAIWRRVGENDVVLDAGQNLTGLQYHFVQLDNTGRVVGQDAAGGDGVIGVLQNIPTAPGQAAVVRFAGRTNLICGAALAVKAQVTSNNAGRAIAATKGSVNTADAGGAADALLGSNVLAIMLEGAAANGDKKLALVRITGSIPTTAS